MWLLNSIMLVVYFMSGQMTFASIDIQADEIEKSLRAQFPTYDFSRVLRPVVTREGKDYQADPYVVENIYQSSTLLCRVREVPLKYSKDKKIWTLSEDHVHRGLVYKAAVIEEKREKKACMRLDYNKDFFVTTSPITDDAIVKVYRSFLDRNKIESKALGFVNKSWSKDQLDFLVSTIKDGKFISLGVNSFGFFQKTIDYEVMLGFHNSSMGFLFHVYFEDGLNIRKIESVHGD